MRRLSLVAALCVAPAWAQNPASVQVLSDTSKLPVGRTYPFWAVARAGDGTVVNTSWRWTVSDTNLADISAEGVLTPKRLGIVRVRATSTNNVWSEAAVQLTPARLELTPASAAAVVGDRVRFNLRVLDTQNREIPGANVQWNVITGNGFNSNAAAVDSTGQVRALAEGNLYVRAMVNYGTYQPGFQNQFQALSELNIEPPKHFKLSRLIGRTEAGQTTAPWSFKPTALIPAGGDNLLLNASAGGLTSGLMLWNGSAFEMVAPAGEPAVAQASLVNDHLNFSANSKGEIAVQTTVTGSQDVIWRGAKSGLSPVIWEGMIFGSYGGLSSVRITRRALGEDGSLVFHAFFRTLDNSTTYNGLFRLDPLGFVQLVISSQEPLAALGGVPSFDVDSFGTGPDGTVYFVAFHGARRALFRQPVSGKLERIIGTEDALEGSTVTSFMGSGMHYVGTDGIVVVGLRLANNTNYLVRLPQGRTEGMTTLRINSWSSTYGASEAAGVLTYITPQNQPNGLYLWKGSNLRALYSVSQRTIDSGVIENIYAAALHEDGRVTALLQTDKSSLALVRFDGSITTLARTGDPIPADPTPSMWGFLPGPKTSGPHVVAGGRSGSIWKVGAGGLEPAVTAGYRFAAPWVFTGAATWNARRGSDGALYVTQTSGYGVVRIDEAGWKQVFVNNKRLENGVTLFNPYEVRVNREGAMLTTQSTDRGDQTVAYTTPGGKTEIVITDGSVASAAISADGFGPVNGWTDAMLDERGRIGVILRNRAGESGFFVWEGGTWKSVLRRNQSIGGLPALNFASVRTADSSFFFRVQAPGGGWMVCEYRDGAPTVRVGVDEVTANGVLVNTIGLYDVNSNGDVAFQYFNFGGTFIGVKRGDRFLHGYTNNQWTAEGDLLWRISDIDLRDDGSLYVLAVTVNDRLVLYRADPQ